ncbi:uncharacterized protein TM35_000731140 [Trypanosoma theileri]|uniref:Mucin-associated surface protein (MASP) n=1 Tax=Trypanosoma theileri TaxID=67003 RepID=A0A1X0NH39_9TRYP|nr:uncharacterized protein TM35_000731140 [Trypanosoma theileri]ORC83390.1 hypothetical protein TM35_000731140 [Trypanosoma theileri]
MMMIMCRVMCVLAVVLCCACGYTMADPATTVNAGQPKAVMAIVDPFDFDFPYFRGPQKGEQTPAGSGNGELEDDRNDEVMTDHLTIEERERISTQRGESVGVAHGEDLHEGISAGGVEGPDIKLEVAAGKKHNQGDELSTGGDGKSDGRSGTEQLGSSSSKEVVGLQNEKGELGSLTKGTPEVRPATATPAPVTSPTDPNPTLQTATPSQHGDRLPLPDPQRDNNVQKFENEEGPLEKTQISTDVSHSGNEPNTASSGNSLKPNNAGQEQENEKTQSSQTENGTQRTNDADNSSTQHQEDPGTEPTHPSAPSHTNGAASGGNSGETLTNNSASTNSETSTTASNDEESTTTTTTTTTTTFPPELTNNKKGDADSSSSSISSSVWVRVPLLIVVTLACILVC